MDVIFDIISTHEKFYSVLSTYDVLEESFDFSKKNVIEIKTKLKLQNKHTNQFSKFLSKMMNMYQVILEIDLLIDKFANTISYTLSSASHGDFFELKGKMMYDNELNLLIHECESLKTESKIVKMQRFRKMILSKMENDIKTICQNLQKFEH